MSLTPLPIIADPQNVWGQPRLGLLSSSPARPNAWEQGGSGPPSSVRGCAASTAAAFQWHPQSSQHALPLIPSIPSLVMIGTITSPATGSAHHQPSTALRSKPPNRIADK